MCTLYWPAGQLSIILCKTYYFHNDCESFGNAGSKAVLDAARGATIKVKRNACGHHQQHGVVDKVRRPPPLVALTYYQSVTATAACNGHAGYAI